MITIIPKPQTLMSPLITSVYINNHHLPSFPFASSLIQPKLAFKRHRFRVKASSLVLPLLPFPVDQVLVPSEAKTLHLYEARYIALLEESLFKKNKLFVHFVLDPIGFSGISAEASFAARYGCLVIIEKVDRLEIGALVLIRGVGRVKILKFKQTEPYLTGEVTPLQDNVSQTMSELNSKVLELKEAVHNLNSLEIKLKALSLSLSPCGPIPLSSPGSASMCVVCMRILSLIALRAPREALLHTQTTNSLVWAEKQLTLDNVTYFIPPVAELVSFVALQSVSGATETELLKLQREKLRAMDTTDTIERLKKSMELVRNNIYMLAAKLALQSLEMT